MIHLQAIDRSLFLFFNHNLSSSFFDSVMPFITDHVPYLLLPVVLFFLFKDRRVLITSVIVSFIALSLSDGITGTLKNLIERPRPFLTIKEAIVLVGRGGSYSMPSAHASNVFSVVTVLCYFLGRLKDGFLRGVFIVYILVVAVTVSLSRIYVGVHYPSDVIVGAFIGFGVGIFTVFGYGIFSKLQRQKREFAVLLIILTGLSVLRLYYIAEGPLDLSPDEAQYWDWSRNLALSYYSKGPGIAYIIKLSTLLFGNTEIGIRVPAVVFLYLSSIIVFFITSSISSRFDSFESLKRQHEAGLLAALLLNTIPLFATYGVVNTIDSPLIFFWSVALGLFWVCVKDWPVKETPSWNWILLGVAIGLGVLVKYTMVFFVFSAFLYLLFNKDKRGLFLRIKPWLSLIFTAIVSSPIVIWNYQHNWVTLRHTAGQAHINEGLVLRPERFLEFLGSQLGVIGPVVFVFMIIAMIWVKRNNRDGGYLFWFFAPTFLFFLLKSLQGKVQANWALPCYISALIGLSIYAVFFWRNWSRKLKATFAVGIALSLIITVVAHYPFLIRLKPKFDPSARLRGWHQLGQEVSRIARKLGDRYFIFSDRYQVTAELAFYVSGNPRTYCVNLGRRMNQYDLWPGFHQLRGYNAIFVKIGKSSLPEKLKGVFDSCERSVLTVTEHGYVLRTYSIFVCRNFHGMKRQVPNRF